MELVYITRAIRRYWWVVAVGAGLGLLAGLFLGGGSGSVYEAQARVLIAPPDSGMGGTSNDRYVQNQILVFDSAVLAEAVAAELDIEPVEARQSTVFAQLPNSDIVTVTVTAPSPELAQGIANGYVDAYFEALRTQLADAQAPDLGAINEAITEVETALAEVDAQIEVVLAPYLDVPDGVAPPTIEQVSPTLDTERRVLLDQYFRLLASRNEMELGARTRVGTQVVQRAGLPTVPNAEGMSLLLIAGPMAGLMLGGLLAVTLARMSPRVLDDDEASTILGTPVAATLPSLRALHPHRTTLEAPLPAGLAPIVQELCVRAEASQVSGEALVVVVAGADPHAGATTLALAMATQFGANGSQVLLVDADRSDPELTVLAGEGVSGIRLLLSEDSGRSPSGRPERNRPLHPYIRTVLQGVRFVGWGDPPSGQPLRRQDVTALVARAAEHAQVVVVDAGTLMEAASSVQLAQIADVVVLAMPGRRQRRAALEVASRQLVASRGGLLPVLTGAVVPKTPRAVSPATTVHDEVEGDRDLAESATPRT